MAGMGDDATIWAPFQKRLGPEVRTCAWDYPGAGQSTAAAGPIASVAAAALHATLCDYTFCAVSIEEVRRYEVCAEICGGGGGDIGKHYCRLPAGAVQSEVGTVPACLACVPSDLLSLRRS